MWAGEDSQSLDLGSEIVRRAGQEEDGVSARSLALWAHGTTTMVMNRTAWSRRTYMSSIACLLPYILHSPPSSVLHPPSHPHHSLPALVLAVRDDPRPLHPSSLAANSRLAVIMYLPRLLRVPSCLYYVCKAGLRVHSVVLDRVDPRYTEPQSSFDTVRIVGCENVATGLRYCFIACGYPAHLDKISQTLIRP